MTKRTKSGQMKHDLGVIKSAQYYKKQNYNVTADLPGYKKPKKINGFLPDLIAKKGKKEVVLEVETKKTVSADKKQQQAFRRYTNSKTGAKFKIKIV